MSNHSRDVEQHQLGNNYIPMEKMLLDTDEIEENRKSAETYLTQALGSTLGEILEECAKCEPEDPIMFVADSLERWFLSTVWSVNISGIFRKFNTKNTKPKRERKFKKTRPKARDSPEKNALKEYENSVKDKNIESPPPNYSAVASISHIVASSDIPSTRSSHSTSSRESFMSSSDASTSDATSQHGVFSRK